MRCTWTEVRRQEIAEMITFLAFAESSSVRVEALVCE
jgi:hypothetical protein